MINFVIETFFPSGSILRRQLRRAYLWLVGNGRMVVIVVIIVPPSSIPY